MNIAICDDNVEFTDEIKRYVEFYFFDNNKSCDIYVFNDGKTACESKIEFDIAFLDIEVGEYSGLDIGREMKKANNNILFIVVTAYSKYLDDAFDMNVLRFLEKPIVPERLYGGLDRAVEIIDKATVSFFLCDDKNTYKSILAEDIVMVVTEYRHTRVYTMNGSYSTNQKLCVWQNKLTASYFVMPHGSYIINMNKIIQFSRTEIVLRGVEDYTVTVAPKRQSEFKRILTRYLESRQ